MGYELRRQLRNVLGPDITGLQRAVALEIADDAKEETRISLAPLDDLVRWTGAKDASVVRNALKRLAASGWEFRMPIGKGKDGRLLYAVPGRRMTFRVPDFEGVATATPKGEQGLPHEGAGATPQPPQGGAGAHSEGAGAPPSSSDPSREEEEASSQGGARATPSRARDYAWTAFGAFWTCYPLSKDIEKTKAAWREALDSGAEPQHLVDRATAYAHERAGEDPRFTKHSANWLRDRRYEDDYATAPQPGGKPNLRSVPDSRPTHDDINNWTEEEIQNALRIS